jgi:phage antirepressor YoqD-like protein
MRNSDIVVKFKVALVKEFYEMTKRPSPVDYMKLTTIQILQIAMQAEQERLVLEQVVAEQKPQVQAFQLIAGSDGSICFTDAAKALQQRPRDLTAWLSAHKWIYKRAGSDSWLGYQSRVQANLIEHKTLTVERSDGSSKVVTHARITPKGLSKLALVFKEAA